MKYKRKAPKFYSNVLQGTLKNKKVPIYHLGFENRKITSQKIKEATFQIIRNYIHNFEYTLFIDAFAGSGQMGIEAFSRSFMYSIFYDRSQERVREMRVWLKSNQAFYNTFVMKKNFWSFFPNINLSLYVELLTALSLTKSSEVEKNDETLTNKTNVESLVIFIDPPYSIYLENKQYIGILIDSIQNWQQEYFNNTLLLLQTPAFNENLWNSYDPTFLENLTKTFDKQYQYGGNNLFLKFWTSDFKSY